MILFLILCVGIFIFAKPPINPDEAAVPPTQEPTSTSGFPQRPTSTPLPPLLIEGEMWISRSEILRLPTSGGAWDKMRSTAYENWGTANLKDLGNKHAINTLAGAFVYTRTGDPSLRIKVRDGILAAKQTLDESSEWQTRQGELAFSRQLGAYVISADLIHLKDFDPAADDELRNWLRTIRTTDVGTHGRWKSLTYTCENAVANWSGFACASRIAASIYLEDTADVQRAANIIRAWMGERQYYPPDAPGKNGYFQHSADYQTSWSCDEATWTAVSPYCVKSGIDLDGSVVEDASRGGECCILQGEGIGYSWEVLQGVFVSTELLYRTGNFGDPYAWSNQALKRALDFMERSGWDITKPATYVPWMANARYSTSYPLSSTADGRIMSWGDWLYQK
jgi:hypothetical protein